MGAFGAVGIAIFCVCFVWNAQPMLIFNWQRDVFKPDKLPWRVVGLDEPRSCGWRLCGGRGRDKLICAQTGFCLNSLRLTSPMTIAAVRHPSRQYFDPMS